MAQSHILQISTEPTWRGGERQMSLLIKGLAKKGVACHIACQKDSVFWQRHHDDFPGIAVDFRGKGMLSSLLAIRKYCYTHSIGIIDAHSSRGHGYALILKHLIPHLKVVVHRRVDNLPGKGMIHRYKYLANKIDRYVAISGAIGQVLIDYGVSEDKVSVVHSAVPAIDCTAKARHREALKTALNWQEDRPIIANVAFLTKQKGHETLIRALHHLKGKGTPFYAFIAGDGPLRESSEKLAQELGLTELAFLGVRSDPLELLLSSDILAMPSNNEGLGTTILDALQAGLAVAATEVGGIPEIIQHGQTGLLSKVGDWKSHGENIFSLLSQPELKNELAAAGLKHVLNQFSPESMVQGNLNIYKGLAEL